MKRFQPQSALAITLGQEKLAASLVRLDLQTCKVLPPHPIASLKIGVEAALKNPTAAGTELSAALHAAACREKRFVICLPPELALTASVDLPEISPEDLRDYFDIRAEREFSVPASEFRLSSSAYCLADGKQRATLAAIPVQKMEAVENLIKAAGGRPLSISLGLDACLLEPIPLLHFIAEECKTTLAVSTGGGIATLRTLSGPSSSTESAFDPVAFVREVRITLGRLPESVRSALELARFHGPQAGMLRQLIGEGVERLGIVPEQPTGFLSNPAELAASRFLLNQPVAFENIVAEPNPWLSTFERFNTQRGRKVALASIALIFLPLLVFLYRIHQEGSLQAEWDGMKTSVASLEAIQQKIRLFRPWFESNPQNLQVLQSLITAFPERGEVWTKSVQVKAGAVSSQGTKVICSGYARNQAAVMALMDRLLKTPGVTALSQRTLGNNPVQFTATYIWRPQNDQ